MDLRPLTKADMPALGELARRAFPFDPVEEALVREKTIEAPDYLPDLGLVAEEGGRPVGFAMGHVAERRGGVRGWVRLLAVDPAWQRRGIGSALLQTLEPRLRTRGAQAIGIFDGPVYLTPGIDFRDTAAYCFLLKNHYKQETVRKNLRCSLGPQPFEVEGPRREFAAKGVIVRRAGPADAGGIDEWLTRVFPTWRLEVACGLKNDPPSFHGAWRAGRLIGFAAYHGWNRTWPFFGPMAVDPAERHAGLGRLLLYLCLNDLLAKGFDWAIIPWVGPIPFYSKCCGAVIDRAFWGFEKTF